MNYGRRFVTLYRRQRSRPSPWIKKCKKAKWLSEEALQIAVKRRARRDKKAFLITHQSGWLLSKSLQAINAREGVEKREPSYTVGGNAN